jgi:hypothetical protein
VPKEKSAKRESSKYGVDKLSSALQPMHILPLDPGVAAVLCRGPQHTPSLRALGWLYGGGAVDLHRAGLKPDGYISAASTVHISLNGLAEPLLLPVRLSTMTSRMMRSLRCCN